ncbi:MAG TPA: hypothetical protein VF837_01805 [Patescibacteria group bacterium]
MTDKYADILYPGSPFLPEITLENITTVQQDISVRHRPVSVAVSFQLCEMAIDLNEYHGSDPQWLNNIFKADLKDLDLFMFGYTMAPSLIIGSFIIDAYGPKAAFNYICPPATDHFLSDVNIYKSNHLIPCSDLYTSLKDHSKKAGLDIFTYLEKVPFSTNRFFQIGHEASRLTFINFFEQLDWMQ